MKDTCYYCGDLATSEEHAPPKCIFPSIKDTHEKIDYRSNLITVPSCDVHNTRKSKEDEYLCYVLALSSSSNEVAINQFLTKISRAITRSPTLINRLFMKYKKVEVSNAEKDIWHKTIAIPPEEGRLKLIFTHIAKAIYFNETNEIWSGKIDIIIELMLSLTDVRKNERQQKFLNYLDKKLYGINHKGSNPDVFSYQFVQMEGKALLKMYFYGNSKVTAISM